MTESGLMAALLESTALAPDVTTAHVVQLCDHARTHHLAAVRVAPLHVAIAATSLQGSPTAPCAVVGHPSGAATTDQKVAESAAVLDHGATEVDLILNSALLRAGDQQAVRAEILAVAQVLARNPHVLLKAVVDASVIEGDALRLAARLAIQGGAHYIAVVRDSGATAPSIVDVAVLREGAGMAIGVAAIGVDSAAAANALIAAGADRIGSDDAISLLAAAR